MKGRAPSKARAEAVADGPGNRLCDHRHAEAEEEEQPQIRVLLARRDQPLDGVGRDNRVQAAEQRRKRPAVDVEQQVALELVAWRKADVFEKAAAVPRRFHDRDSTVSKRAHASWLDRLRRRSRAKYTGSRRMR